MKSKDTAHSTRLAMVPGTPDIGAKLHEWHSSQTDPVYMVGSLFVAGKYAPIELVDRAIRNLRKEWTSKAIHLADTLERLADPFAFYTSPEAQKTREDFAKWEDSTPGGTGTNVTGVVMLPSAPSFAYGETLMLTPKSGGPFDVKYLTKTPTGEALVDMCGVKVSVPFSELGRFPGAAKGAL